MDVALGDRDRTVPGDSGQYEHITPCFFSKVGQCGVPKRVVIATHDLESLIRNPPSGCDVQQYAVEADGNEGEEIQLESFEVEIPVTISYDDKNGNQFKIKHLLHYDTYMEKGEMIRIDRIEKVAPK